MATVTDYRVLLDGSIELKRGNVDSIGEFITMGDLPANFVQGDNIAKPILAFIVRPVEDTELHVSVFSGPNSTEISKSVFKASSRRGVWVPFSGKLLEGGPHADGFHFHIGTGGPIRISNVVLWHQVKI